MHFKKDLEKKLPTPPSLQKNRKTKVGEEMKRKITLTLNWFT
jgi:hypothetical protein